MSDMFDFNKPLTLGTAAPYFVALIVAGWGHAKWSLGRMWRKEHEEPMAKFEAKVESLTAVIQQLGTNVAVLGERVDNLKDKR